MTDIVKSSTLTNRDKENRALAVKLIKNSNSVVTSFAKQMITTSLSAVGVILALAKFRAPPNDPRSWPPIAITLVCVGCVLAALVFVFALQARRIKVSLEDYADAPSELLEIAHRRQRLTTVAFAILAVSLISAIIVLIAL